MTLTSERRAEIEEMLENVPFPFRRSAEIITELLAEIDRLNEGMRDAAMQVLFQSGPVWDMYVDLGGTEQ